MEDADIKNKVFQAIGISAHPEGWIIRPDSNKRGVRGMYAATESFKLDGSTLLDLTKFLKKIDARISPYTLISRDKDYEVMALAIREGSLYTVYTDKRNWEER